MKYCFTPLLLLLLTVCFVSCKKDKNTPPSSAPLMGTWELRRGPAGIGSSREYLPGNGQTIKFSSGDKYVQHWSSQSADSGTFRLTSEVAKYNNKRVNMIRFGDSPTRDVFNIVNDTLSLSTYPYDDKGNMIMDGGTVDYIRISE